MKIAVGCDHGGYRLLQEIKAHLSEIGVSFDDFGTYTEESCDYPVYAEKVADAVIGGGYDFGILVCGTGIGMSMAANKVKGIRAAVLCDCFSAEAARNHNNANIICIGERVVGPGLANRIVDTFMNAEFAGGRHERRVNLIGDIENRR